MIFKALIPNGSRQSCSSSALNNEVNLASKSSMFKSSSKNNSSRKGSWKVTASRVPLGASSGMVVILPFCRRRNLAVEDTTDKRSITLRCPPRTLWYLDG
uniref:Uncharacterized protein n=1 Tax=Romanomermis culicivorax TaxID=13658 RepID=A0A915I071_ROMCU